jgi:hypothetical protein
MSYISLCAGNRDSNSKLIHVYLFDFHLINSILIPVADVADTQGKFDVLAMPWM